MSQIKCPFANTNDCSNNIDINERKHTQYCYALSKVNFYKSHCPFYKAGTVIERLQTEELIREYTATHKSDGDSDEPA